ncbi:phosphorylase family protein [Bacillus pretiosus]
MKALIIEDDPSKLEVILSTLEVFNELTIECCDNIFEGKGNLARKYYDILILDMNLPFDKNEEPEDYAGYTLFKELQRVAHLKKPGEIIMLTSFKDLHERYKDEVAKGLFTIIKYDSLSNSWCKQITTRITYLLTSAGDATDTTSGGYEVDIAIITAVPVEHQVLKNQLQYFEEHKVKGDNTFYIKGKINESCDKSIVIATQHQMGMVAAAVLATKIIRNFKPKYLAMVGIAAGIRGQGNYGDIILPTEIWEYTSGKIAVSQLKDDTSQEKGYSFAPEPKYLTMSSKVKEILNKNYSDVLIKIKDEWKGDSPKTAPALIRGPMACGSIVVQNEKVIQEFIIPHNRKIKGVDMETYGVLYAVENAYEPKPEVIICKSICDFGDELKGDDFQEYAAFTSAQFLLHLINNEIFES